MREMDRAARAGSSRMTKEQSISQLQKMANAEYFKDGGGPLFPGSYLLLDSYFSPPCAPLQKRCLITHSTVATIFSGFQTAESRLRSRG